MTYALLGFGVIAALGLLLAAGAPIALALKARGFSAVLVGIPAAIAVAAVAPAVLALANINWHPLSFLISAWVIACVALVVRLACLRGEAATGHSAWFRGSSGLFRPVASAALSGALIALILVRSMGGPDAISQTYDANFHLNLVSVMLETGDASPFNVDLTTPGKPQFYPAVWHALAALIASLIPSQSVTLAVNALTYVSCAVIWPLGAVALSRAICGPSTRSGIVGAITASLLPLFPLIFAGYGVLYPLMLSASLLPFSLTALLKVTELFRAPAVDYLPRLTAWILLLGSAGAISFAHPNGFFALWIFIFAFTVHCAMRAVRNKHHATLMLAVLLVIVALTVILWMTITTDDNVWQVTGSPVVTFFNTLLMSPRMHARSWLLGVLLIAAMLWSIRKVSLRPFVSVFLLISLLFVVARTLPFAEVRTALTGVWYNDSWRLAGFAMFAAFPLLIFITDQICAVVLAATKRQMRKRQLVKHPRLKPLVCAFGVLVLYSALQSPASTATLMKVEEYYQFSDDHAPLVSGDEKALLKRLASEVPEGETVINNPWNGGALAQAVGDRNVLFPHGRGDYPKEWYSLVKGIATGSPEACALSRELEARYVLDFGTEFIFTDTVEAEPFQNITKVKAKEAPALTLIDHEGDSKLFEVTGCD